jgi:tubulin--tyrosine ligase
MPYCPTDCLQQFHLRAYCVSSGVLSLYLYSRILALFSAVPYVTPVARDDHSPVDLTPHLTNTSLHTHRGEAGVRLLDELVGCHIFSNPAENPNNKLMLMAIDVETLVDQIVNILAETFKAALENPIHFQVFCLSCFTASCIYMSSAFTQCF